MSEHVQREFLSLGRNREQVIRDGSFAARKEFIQNELAGRHFSDRNMMIQGQLAKLNALLIHEKIPDFYAYAFMGQLALCPEQQLEQSLHRQLQLIRKKQSHYHTINRTLVTRETCIRSLLGCMQSLFQANEEGIMRKFSEQVQHYRQLTALVIEQIREWIHSLHSISASVYGDEHVAFFYHNQDYLLKILQDIDFVSKSFLSTRVVFSHKQDPFLMRPFTESQSTDPYVQMFRFESSEQQRYMRCLQFLAEERADYLRRKITVREDRIKEIKRVYQAKHLSSKIFMVGRQDGVRQPKAEVPESQIDFVDQPVKAVSKESRPLMKSSAAKQLNRSKEKEMQTKGEMMRKIRDMDFSSAAIINPKKLSRLVFASEDDRPANPIARSISLGFIKRQSKVAKVEKEEPNTDFEQMLRRKELQVLDSDSVKRRTMGSIKLQDKISLRRQFDHREGAEELQKIVAQLEQTFPQRQEGFVLRRGGSKERGRTLLQNNEQAMVSLRQSILKEMEDDQSKREKFEQQKERERERLQEIIKHKLQSMTVMQLQKQKESRVQDKQAVAYELGKLQLFGMEEPSPKKSQRLAQLEVDLKREMQMKWLREVQEELSHRQDMNDHQKATLATNATRQKQLEIALRKKEQEERFGQIEEEERAKAMQLALRQQQQRKREMQAELAMIVEKEKVKLEQFSGQQRGKLQEQMKEVMKSRLLTSLRRESSLLQTQQSQMQRHRQEQQQHREQMRRKMEQQFKVQKQLQRQRQKQQKGKKLRLIAQEMQKLDDKVEQSRDNHDHTKAEAMRQSLADIPDFRKGSVNAGREQNIKRLREDFEMQLFAFNREDSFNIQQDNFLLKDFKAQLDNEDNLNSKEAPLPEVQQTEKQQPKLEQNINRRKDTSQNAEKEEVSSQLTDKFTRFSQFEKQQQKMEDADIENELKRMKVQMSTEEYRIYQKKKSVIDEKRIVPDPKLKQNARIAAHNMLDNFQIMQIHQPQPQIQELDLFQPQPRGDIQISQLSSIVGLPQHYAQAPVQQDVSEMIRLTAHSRKNSISKKRFATSDDDQFETSSFSEQQKVQRRKKAKKATFKQPISHKSPHKQQKHVSRQQLKKQDAHLQAQKAYFRTVSEQDLDNYLTTHFKNVPKLIRKLNLLKKDELLKTILECKSVMIVECAKGDSSTGLAFVCQNQNKQSIRSLNILHLGAYLESNMISVLLQTRDLLFAKDICMEITLSMYYDKQNEEQSTFIKSFEERFDPYGAIFQKRISNEQTERKHVLRRIIGEESNVATKDREVGMVKIEQHLFAHSSAHSLGVHMELATIDRTCAGWTVLSLFLGKYANEGIFQEELNSDVSEKEKSVKYISKMTLRLKQSSVKDIQYRTFESPFEANLKLVEQGLQLIKCDPSVQQNDIPVYWSRLNQSMQPVLSFVSARESFAYRSHMQTASFLRYACTKASKVINLKSSLYSSVITVIPCKPSNYKLLVTTALEFDAQPNVSLDLYLKLFLANLSQHNLNTDDHIWIPQIKSKAINRIEEAERFGFANEMRTKLQIGYSQYMANCVAYSRTHRDLFVTPPFIVAVLDSNIERLMEGSPIFAERIDIADMVDIEVGRNLVEQSDL